jgi:hypothetical protein
MDPDKREDVYAHLMRLLRKNSEQDPKTFHSTRKAIDESRRLLADLARNHPEIQ